VRENAREIKGIYEGILARRAGRNGSPGTPVRL